MPFEGHNGNEDSVTILKQRLEEAGLLDRVPYFNDVLTGKKAPEGYGEPVAENITYKGIVSDIYHTDSDTDVGGVKAARVYVHLKDAEGGERG